jgi:TPP-dependent pyruvate/acetoin dehydrogenase alpha subunit
MRLTADGFMTEPDAQRIAEAAREEMAEAVEFALASPFPAPEEAVNYVYA